MGRPAEYSRDEVLANALQIFRAKGYKRTSIKDLEEVTGLKPGSIYSAFGSKRNFFIETLNRYFALSEERLITELSKEQTPLAGLKRFFGGTLEDVVSSEPDRCCYVIKTALELSGEEPEIQSMIQSYFGRVEQCFSSALAKGQQIGEVIRTDSSQILGKMFINLLYGLNVEGMVAPQKEVLNTMVKRLFDSVEVHPQVALEAV